jgi:hypothetical protein
MDLRVERLIKVWRLEGYRAKSATINQLLKIGHLQEERATLKVRF